MTCRACRGVKARPLRNVRVCSRRERTASTSRARTSSRVVPSRGRRPIRPSRRSSSSRSFSACVSPVRTRAWSCRARCRNRRRTNWDRHSSFLFFRPYFFRSSFSALIRSPSHGWEGRSNFARENFGSPNGSLLLLFLLAALFLFRLRGGDRGLLDHTDGEPRPPVAPGPLPADLLALLVPHALVGTDHPHPVDIVPEPDLDVGPEHVHVEPRLPVLRAVHQPMGGDLPELPEGLLNPVRVRLAEVPEPLRPGDAREGREGLRDSDPDARDRGQRVRDGPRAVEVRVRHADDVPEVLLDALEFLRSPRGLGLLLLFLRRLLGPLPLLRLRGRRGRCGGGLLFRHGMDPGWGVSQTSGRI